MGRAKVAEALARVEEVEEVAVGMALEIKMVPAAGMEVESSESGQRGALPTLGVCAFWDSVGYDH